jgi:flagellar biosynthesis protein FlhA
MADLMVQSQPFNSQMLKKNSDVIMALALIGVLALMVVPLPSFMLDAFLALNVTVSLAILLICLYTTQPLDFSSFPSVLLVTTLFRLALNIASTRLILLHGNEGPEAAGAVIMAFGQFVVGGNYVVGAVLFLILVIINFVVITKGAGRVAEVAARFTLDAMPGKQMAIDADLSAGSITDKEAKARRLKISREAEFYGSMDGASKFVRGDAVAGILIMLINLIGGFVIGVWQQGMPFDTALANYSLLTVGEGLMAQIPAIIISTAGGIIVTRSADENNFGNEISGQFMYYPRACYTLAGVLFCFGLLPGLPHVAFLLLAGSAYLAGRMAKERAVAGAEEILEAGSGEEGDRGEQISSIKPVEILELEVGYALVPLVDESQEGELLDRIRNIRRQFAQKMGFIVPPIHIHDNLQLRPYEYSIMIKGAKVGGGELTGQFLAMDSGATTGVVDGASTTEPVFGLPAVWIRGADKDQAQLFGYTVVDNTTVVATHISETIKKYAQDLIGRQELQQLMDNLSMTCPKVVDELVPSLLTIGTVLRVIKNLLREGTSIRDFRSIMETLADFGGLTKDPDMLTEFVRQALGRSIVEQLKSEDDTLCLLSLDRSVEEAVIDGVQSNDQGSYLACEPAIVQKILTSLRKEMEKFNVTGTNPVLIASPSIRRHVKKLTERFIPNLAVLSHSEVPPNIKIQSLGVVSLNAN